MPDLTSVMSQNKPKVNDAEDQDVWGGQLRDNIDLYESWFTKEEIDWGISFPANGTYTIRLKARHAGIITETTTDADAGTGTATFKVNGAALGGTANSVSTTEQSQSHGSSNTFAAGDTISVTFSSVSGLSYVYVSIHYTRTSAGS